MTSGSGSGAGRPLIGITGRQYPYGEVAGTPDLLADALVDAVLTDYVRAVIASGGLPVHIPFDVDPVEIVWALDGLILTGGADIDPTNYGAARDQETGRSEPRRDEVELALATAALDRGSPTLGVCRGMQVLNVAAGGTLHQHVPAHACYQHRAPGLIHDIATEHGSVLAEVYGPAHRVNSYHHQTIDRPGEPFRVTARADDGEAEGLEHRDAPIVAVQWHPEMLRTRDPIFDWLVAAAAGGTAAES
ncbi:MAG: gamma-glutamyl-gamma-aminobutyrate hydrolase family protein [Actinomycetota bacterium]